MKNEKMFVMIVLIMIGLGCIEDDPNISTISGSTISAALGNTNVTVVGRQILVNEQHFIIKSVGYSPVPIGNDPDLKKRDYYTQEYANIYNRDLPLLREMGANTVRLWSWDNDADHTDFLNKAYNNGKDPIYIVAPFWISHRLDLSEPDVRTQLKSDFRKMVAKNKNNPAILMWIVGNELNAKGEHTYDDLFSLIDEMAEQAHLEEGANYRPVTTSLVDKNITGTIAKYEKNMTHLDVWSVQLYRGKDFGSFFKEYQNVSSKPVVILEFGIDSYDDRKKAEYEDVQAEYASALWRHLIRNSDITAGGSIMSYSDGWYKGKISRGGRDNCPDDSASVHSDCGYPMPSHPDGYANVEWWGIMRTKDNGKNPDIVEPRKVYYTLKELWANKTLGDNKTMTINNK